jgi:predicted nucleic acid-binding protein
VVELHVARDISLQVLDLTRYELGNALLRGKRISAAAVATVLDALAEICPAATPTADELRLAASLAEQHDLTLYDATYAAVSQARGARLATYDGSMLDAGLGVLPGAAAES